nr:uncharacterized protein LOC129452974 [Misgurnus anguillicaudatus]
MDGQQSDCVFGDEVKSVSVIVGDSVTLQTDIKLQRDDLIDWWFEDKQDRLAKLNKEANTIRIYDDVRDGRFRDRLKLNTENGDLTITNITTQHTGRYKLDISNTEKITTKTFNISVSVDTRKLLEDGNNIKVNGEDQSSGLSSGVVAGLCVFLLVLVFALAVAVFLYRRLSRTTGNNRADINEEETGKESTEMKKPLRTESNSSDVP